MDLSDEKVKKIVDEIFKKIENSNSIDDLKKIRNDLDFIPQKNRMKIVDYPKIEFSISPNEIKELKEKGLISKENIFTENITTKIKNPIAKILYSIAWKNGDLTKLKHIIKGILDTENDNEPSKAFVFHQFGKYLTKSDFEPIIDQHVLRSFSIKITNSQKDIQDFRALDEINNKNKYLIYEYKDWLKSKELKRIRKYHYYIDIILFELGKTIKKK